jgi:3-oxoacyl-[acyl-carrier protein] reductase
VPPQNLDGAALQASFAANFEAPVLLARRAAELMAAKGTRGAIVLCSSMQGVAAFAGSLAYAAPKAALVHAARILAKEHGGARDIRVNVVAPGVTGAGMARASIEAGKYDAYVERGVIPRFGRPEDVARVVRLLLEPDSYLTGQVITVDGGLTLRREG